MRIAWRNGNPPDSMSAPAPRMRRAYQLDVAHFMTTLGIAAAAELRQADHKVVIAS
jgi:hypothetical protein